MAKEKLYYERYTNIYRFMDTIQARPDNGKFGTSSRDKGEWSGTNTWEEAVQQFSNGLPDRAERLTKALAAFKVKANVTTSKVRPQNHYYGSAPNVPAAIIGLPKSMRRIERIPQKVKAVSILYDMTQNAGTSAETLQKSGENVLNLVYLLECYGYRVSLDVIAFNSYESDRFFILAVNLKEWKQHLDVLKLSFPLTSPAMFRRFGFKWAETMPEVNGNHVWGYGRHIDKKAFKMLLPLPGLDNKASYFIDVNDCENADFDAVKLAKNLGFTV